MAKELKPGNEVAWDTPQGATQGKVVRKLTSETRIKGHVAKPTEDDPQYLVKSDKSGAEAAHKPGELRRS
jgi:Hypervirulence associated proteins TUDOR domain